MLLPAACSHSRQLLSLRLVLCVQQCQNRSSSPQGCSRCCCCALSAAQFPFKSCSQPLPVHRDPAAGMLATSPAPERADTDALLGGLPRRGGMRGWGKRERNLHRVRTRVLPKADREKGKVFYRTASPPRCHLRRSPPSPRPARRSPPAPAPAAAPLPPHAPPAALEAMLAPRSPGSRAGGCAPGRAGVQPFSAGSILHGAFVRRLSRPRRRRPGPAIAPAPPPPGRPGPAAPRPYLRRGNKSAEHPRAGGVRSAPAAAMRSRGRGGGRKGREAAGARGRARRGGDPAGSGAAAPAPSARPGSRAAPAAARQGGLALRGRSARRVRRGAAGGGGSLTRRDPGPARPRRRDTHPAQPPLLLPQPARPAPAAHHRPQFTRFVLT